MTLDGAIGHDALDGAIGHYAGWGGGWAVLRLVEHVSHYNILVIITLGFDGTVLAWHIGHYKVLAIIAYRTL